MPLPTLKPCPLCGGASKRERDRIGAFVRCTACYARTRSYAKGPPTVLPVSLAVRDWNRRSNASTHVREDALSPCVWCGVDEAEFYTGPSWRNSAIPPGHLHVECDLCQCRTATIDSARPRAGHLLLWAWNRRPADSKPPAG